MLFVYQLLLLLRRSLNFMESEKNHENLVRTVRNLKLRRTWHIENLVLYRHTNLFHSKVLISEDAA
jgi:hypothetical protein